MKYKIAFLSLLLIVFLSFDGYTQNSDAQVQQLLKEKRIKNKKNTTIDGYRIQLYNGLNENKAKQIYSNFTVMFPDMYANWFYEQIEWKVQVGSFHTKLEAKKALLIIREEFAGAFDLKTKIRI